MQPLLQALRVSVGPSPHPSTAPQFPGHTPKLLQIPPGPEPFPEEAEIRGRGAPWRKCLLAGDTWVKEGKGCLRTGVGVSWGELGETEPYKIALSPIPPSMEDFTGSFTYPWIHTLDSL